VVTAFMSMLRGRARHGTGPGKQSLRRHERSTLWFGLYRRRRPRHAAPRPHPARPNPRLSRSMDGIAAITIAASCPDASCEPQLRCNVLAPSAGQNSSVRVNSAVFLSCIAEAANVRLRLSAG
jgi:hypothetical protein